MNVTDSNADGLKLCALSWDHFCRWAALVIKQRCEALTHSFNICSRHSKGGSSKAYLLDEVANLASVQRHELVHLVHAGLPSVRGDFSAAEEYTEELIQMSEQFAASVSVQMSVDICSPDY